LESLADRSLVIVKFRDLVNELREQNQDLQTQLMRESASKDEVRSSIPEMLDFKVNYKLKYAIIFLIRKCKYRHIIFY